MILPFLSRVLGLSVLLFFVLFGTLVIHVPHNTAQNVVSFGVGLEFMVPDNLKPRPLSQWPQTLTDAFDATYSTDWLNTNTMVEDGHNNGQSLQPLHSLHEGRPNGSTASGNVGWDGVFARLSRLIAIRSESGTVANQLTSLVPHRGITCADAEPVYNLLTLDESPVLDASE